MIIHKTLFAVLMIVAMCLSGISYAQDEQWFMEMGLHFGGEGLPTPEMAGQGEEEVSAGGLVSFSIGAVAQVYKNFELVPAIGFKYDSNLLRVDLFGVDTASWSRSVASVLVIYKTRYFRLGAGYIYHNDPTLRSKGKIEETVWEYDDAVGTSYQIDYLAGKDISLGLRQERIEYKAANLSPVNGNNIGLMLKIFFK